MQTKNSFWNSASGCNYMNLCANNETPVNNFKEKAKAAFCIFISGKSDLPETFYWRVSLTYCQNCFIGVHFWSVYQAENQV